jgi:hypothetical protein
MRAPFHPARTVERVVEPVCAAGPQESDPSGPTNPFTIGALPVWKFLERENVIDRLAQTQRRATSCPTPDLRRELLSRYDAPRDRQTTLDVTA